MRILMISDVYVPRVNGVSTSIQTFRKELEDLGHEVYLIAPHYEQCLEQEYRLFRVESRGVPGDPEDRMMKYGKVLGLIPTIEKLDIDLVHIQTPFVAHYAGMKIARALFLPVIATYHTFFEEYLYHYIPWLPKMFLRRCARQFSLKQCQQLDGIITPSSIIAGLLGEYGVTTQPVTIPTGIELAKFAEGDGENFRERLMISTEKRILLNVSRVAFEKNIDSLFEMLRMTLIKIPEAHLVIAGEGPAKVSLMQQVKGMGLSDHVTFVGYLDRNSELIDCYHAADLFVFSSLTETQGLVLLEAMASGIPVVSVAAMGTKEVLRNDLGAKITDGTADDFSAKVIEVLDNKSLHTNLSQAAIAYAAEWDPRKLAIKMESYYYKVAFGQPPRVTP